MKKTLYDYKDIIKELPIKDKYSKEEILTNNFLIEKEKDIEIYYSPHNEHINSKAKIFIVGITPGFQQMSTAISAARKGFEDSEDIEKIQYKCKEAARFSGSLRNNLISMFGIFNSKNIFKNIFVYQVMIQVIVIFMFFTDAVLHMEAVEFSA